jgi:acetyl esterase/lipase
MLSKECVVLRRLAMMVVMGALGVLLLAGCSGVSVLNSLASDKGYTVTKNAVYDTQSGLALDVYRPENASNAPVVVYFYGGRWQDGSKDDFLFVGQALASQGFVAVLPNYREYPQARFPVFLQDSARAVRWARDNARQYGGDPAKLIVMGHEAGAYNAAMLALDPEYLKAVGMSRSELKGMVGLAGAYNFLPITDPTLRVIFSPPEKFAQTQPVFWADGQNPPLYLVHGKTDEIIPVSNTRDLAQRVKGAGGTVETLLYDNLSNGAVLASLSKSMVAPPADVLDNVSDFIRRVTGLKPQTP